MSKIPELLFPVANGIVWLGFLYLFYQLSCLFAAAMWKRRVFQLRAEQWQIHGAALVRQLELTDADSLPARANAAWELATHASWRSGRPSPVLKRLVDYAATGGFPAAFRVLDEHLLQIASAPSSQRQYATYAQRLGLLGTVIGVAQCFSQGSGSSPDIGYLGFALATTGVGLVIAAAIDLCLHHIHQPAFAQFSAAAYQVRDDVCLQFQRLSGEMDAPLPAASAISSSRSAPGDDAGSPQRRTQQQAKKEPQSPPVAMTVDPQHLEGEPIPQRRDAEQPIKRRTAVGHGVAFDAEVGS